MRHLDKEAVITFRASYALKDYIELVALRSGLSYSDFLRMAIVIGARQQAELLGHGDIQIQVGPPKVWRDGRLVVDDGLPSEEELEAAWEKRLRRLGIIK